MQISIRVFFKTASADFVYGVIASILKEVSCTATEDAGLESERVCPPLKDRIWRLPLVAISLGHVSNWMKIIRYQYNSTFLFFSFKGSSVVSLQSYFSFHPPIFTFIAKLLSLFQGYLCVHIWFLLGKKQAIKGWWNFGIFKNMYALVCHYHNNPHYVYFIISW